MMKYPFYHQDEFRRAFGVNLNLTIDTTFFMADSVYTIINLSKIGFEYLAKTID